MLIAAISRRKPCGCAVTSTQFSQLLQDRDSQGRKMDFLIQELVRETNTIGSKANDAGIAGQVVEIKTCIERLREMVQNIGVSPGASGVGANQSNGGMMAKLIVISGPSGAGKSTVVREILSTCRQPICLSVSATTRPSPPWRN